MPWFDTSTLSSVTALNPDTNSWVYNGLDCLVTYEIREELRAQLAEEIPEVQETYANTLSKLAPVMEMSLRGIRRDQAKTDQVIREMQENVAVLTSHFNYIIKEVFDISINWNSPTQMKTLFYEIMNVKPIRKRNAKGVYAPTLDRDALEKLSANPALTILCNILLAARDLSKSISYLKTPIDEDGSFRTDLNLAGTKTGRLASEFANIGTGGQKIGSNLQNADVRLKYVFIARKKKIMVNVDLEQADSRNMAARIYKEFYSSHGEAEAAKYLNACESGDLHTTVARMAFTKLDWGNDPNEWRKTANQKFYRDYSYRFMAKKLGHGSNYGGKPPFLAKQTKAEPIIIEMFQNEYFKAFPLIPELWSWTKQQLKDYSYLFNLWGRRRFFHDRVESDDTFREALAYSPQSSTAEEIDRAYQTIWRKFPECDLLMQVHDSILFEMDYKKVNTLLPKILLELPARLTLPGDRDFYVPLEAKVGWNWMDAEDDQGKLTNPLGMMKFTANESRVPPAWM